MAEAAALKGDTMKTMKPIEGNLKTQVLIHLADYHRETLKALCRRVGVEDRGDKATLRERIRAALSPDPKGDKCE